MSRLLHNRLPLAIAGALLLATACSDSPNEPLRIPAAVEVVFGEDQIGSVGAQLGDPIVIVVLDTRGEPIPNQPVRFEVTGGGSLQDAPARTDTEGLARVRWTLGTAMHMEQRLDVHAVASSSSSTPLASTAVYATAGPGAAASLVVLEGSPQSNWEGMNAGIAPSVRVLDAYGNPVPGVSVTFAVASGGGSVTNATVTSGPLGVATAGSWRFGPAGPQTLTATSGTLAPVTFAATARSLTPARVILSGGQNQFATVATPVPVAPSVIVQNAAGDALPGIVVTFTPGPNSGNVQHTAVTTGTNGTASVGGWFLGPVAGPQTLVASASPSATFTFQAEATASSPRRLDKTAGDAQTASPGATLPVAPAVTVRDAYGNVVANATVTFSVLMGGGSVSGATAVSNASGVATVGSWTLGPSGGTQMLRASTPGAETDFTARARSGVASQITMHPQNPTSAIPGREVTLSVIVRDDVGDPMPGVPINFSAFTSPFGQGTVLPPSQGVISNAQGIASVRYVMPTNVYAMAGVNASGSGLQTLQMHVDPIVGPPEEIRVTLPNESVVAGGNLGQPIFSVVDSNGTVLPMITVRFTVTAGAGTVDGAAETTVITASPPATTTVGPMWKSGPVAGQNTLAVSVAGHTGVPNVVLTRTTVTPP